MPTRKLPASPHLTHLKNQARDLLRDRPKADPATLQRIREFHPRFAKASDAEIVEGPFALSDAQLAIAREYGFASWSKLRNFVERPQDLDGPLADRIADAEFRQAVEAIDSGDLPVVRRLLSEHPRLASATVSLEGQNYFREPTLVQFCAGNPIRLERLPDNIVTIAEAILEAGGKGADETLGLVASGSQAREQELQTAMIELLVRHGAQPDRALPAALAHEDFEAAEVLLGLGAAMTLDAAAALGRIEEARRLLIGAGPEERHRALAMASGFGHAEIVKILLDNGEDPNRFNPAGYHSHSTPLHQAALNGHLEVVAALLEYGAKKDQKDVLWQGTPLDWAEYSGQAEVAAFLRSEGGLA